MRWEGEVEERELNSSNIYRGSTTKWKCHGCTVSINDLSVYFLQSKRYRWTPAELLFRDAFFCLIDSQHKNSHSLERTELGSLAITSNWKHFSDADSARSDSVKTFKTEAFRGSRTRTELPARRTRARSAPDGRTATGKRVTARSRITQKPFARKTLDKTATASQEEGVTRSLDAANCQSLHLQECVSRNSLDTEGPAELPAVAKSGAHAKRTRNAPTTTYCNF